MNNSEYLVSICVPIYGVEKYIERCVISLFEQTYQNIEYIFVNDCTQDKSIDILKSIIEEYPIRKNYVRIINHERNKGLGAARNTAITNATGMFIIHVDSDDYVEKDIVERLVKKQNENNSDIVTCGYILYRQNKVNNILPLMEYNIQSLILNILSRDATMMIWGRLIRKSLYDNNNITVPNGINMGEDYVTIPKLLYYAKVIDFVNLPLYHYDCYNGGSYTASISEKNIIQFIQCCDNLRVFFDKKRKYIKRIDIAELKFIANSMINCFTNGKNLLDCYAILYKRKILLNKELYKYVKLSNRIVLYIDNSKLIRCYTRVAKLYQCLFKKFLQI